MRQSVIWQSCKLSQFWLRKLRRANFHIVGWYRQACSALAWLWHSSIKHLLSAGYEPEGSLVLPQWPLSFWSLLQRRHRKVWKKKVSRSVGAAGLALCLLAVLGRGGGGIQSQALLWDLLKLQSPQCSLLGWPGVPQPAGRLHACLRVHAWVLSCSQGGRMASSAQGWARPRAAKTCLRSCLSPQSPPGLLFHLLCPSSPVLLVREAAGFGVGDRLAVWATGSAPSSAYFSPLCSTLRVGRKGDAAASR